MKARVISGRNVVLGHLVLLAFGIAAFLVAVVSTSLFGRNVTAILGLLAGVPVFFGFPVLLDKLVGRWLVRERDGEREELWGYLFLLGLAALFLVILGSVSTGTLWWQFRATEQDSATLAEIEASAGEKIFYRRPETLRRLLGPIGHHLHRRSLGDGQWVESRYFVTPLIDASRPEAGCVFLGREAGARETVGQAKQNLLADASPWLVEATGLERSGYRGAAEDAFERWTGEPPACDRPIVLEGSRSRSEEISASLVRLGRLHAFAHGLPFLALVGWLIAGRWNSRRSAGQPAG